jgi:D-alanine transaminase
MRNHAFLNDMTTVYVNGEYVPKERAVISIDDRGFLFGDGIYEGVRAVAGKLFEWDLHAARMVNGLTGLRIDFSAARVAALKEICERLVRDNGLAGEEAFVYIAVTRGAAPRTHHFPPAGTPPTVYASATRFVPPRALRNTGAKAITFEDIRWTRCDLKTVNLLGNVLARQAAVEAGAFEAIFVRDGIVTEGAATTVFAVLDGELRTHPLGHAILPSVTRAVVLDCAAALKLRVREDAVTEAELRAAQELFLCGTITDITPIVTLDQKPIADGKPGPITGKLRDALEARVYAEAPALR